MPKEAQNVQHKHCLELMIHIKVTAAIEWNASIYQALYSRFYRSNDGQKEKAWYDAAFAQQRKSQAASSRAPRIDRPKNRDQVRYTK